MTTGRLLGGRYQVGELLGYGGMAEVHHGRDLRLGRDVAIKTLRTDLARDATFQMRFRREAQNAAALNHPAIVAVYDTGEERGPNGEELPYIIMEFVNGRTLKEVLTAEGRLTPRRAMELTADICAALEFSHRHGIIHRDIKPGNVMLTQTGQVKVMDFGIARALASGATTMTQTSAVIGTAQYLSPEQARGEAVDARSDVYATGCVLFELLCGHPPFVGDNPVSVAYQHVREEPRPPSSSNRDVTPDVDSVVLKALAKNPLNRYQSAGEMRADLLRAAAGRPVSAPPILTEDQMTAMLAPQQTRQAPLPSRDVARAAQQKRRRGSMTVAVALTLLGVLAVTALAIGLYLESHNTVPAPLIVGKSQEEALALVRDAKLKPELRQNVKTGCTVGQVTAQDPQQGAEVHVGGKVKYDFCSGPNMVKVPPLTNLKWDQAESSLKDAKLTPQRVDVDSDKEAETVVSSDPKEGQQVPEGSVVKVSVSSGNQVKIPTLVGLTRESAQNKLDDLGLKANPVFRTADSPDDVGKVTGSDPGEGKFVKKGSTVTIYVGRAAPSSAPPSSANPSSPSPSRTGF